MKRGRGNDEKMRYVVTEKVPNNFMRNNSVFGPIKRKYMSLHLIKHRL